MKEQKFDFTAEKKIKALLRDEVDVTFTDNRTSMISVRKRAEGRYSVRLHSMFSDAGEEVIKAVSDYIKGKRRVSIGIIRRFINDNLDKIKTIPDKGDKCPARTLYAIGRFFNLKEIFNRLNTEYFNGTVSAKITWGRSICNGRRYIRFGSYTEKDDIIRIHPSLDREDVPLYFIESIVYHEMLHKFIGVSVVNGIRRIHTPEFKKMERDFEDYEKARGWEKGNIKRLLKKHG